MRRIRLSLIRISGCDFPGDFRALIEVASDCEVCGRGTCPVGLLETAVATIEAGDDLAPAVAARRLCIKQGLHLVAPLLAFVGAADRAKIVEGTEYLGEPLEIVVERRGRVALRVRRKREAEQNRADGEKLLHARESVVGCP